jgi:hypothetical protein
MFLPFRELLENNGKLFRIVITENIMVNMNINIGKECKLGAGVPNEAKWLSLQIGH